MIYVVIAFLWIALGMYIIFGGADFGSGIVEFFSSKQRKVQTAKIMYKSVGPIWEANHMWLIIAIVILFVGFPKIYSDFSTYLHIPLVIMLIGIIARGTSFTFRNYDAIKDDWVDVYTKIFTYSSVITPFFLGIIAAATVSGSIDPKQTGFLETYIFSWLTLFNVSVGLFTIAICSFLAVIYAIYSLDDEVEKNVFRKRASKYTIAIFLCGILVIGISYAEKIPLLSWIFYNWMGYVAVISATIAIIYLNYKIKNKQDSLIRLLAGLIVLMILFAVSYSHFPNLVTFKNGETLSLLDKNQSPATIDMLGWALLLGSIFILPFFFYLIYAFGAKRKQ